MSKKIKSKSPRLITPELFERVQATLEGRSASTAKARTFTDVGLLKCGHCGCNVTAEIKKGRYIYYYCTGFKGKCPEKSAEEVIEQMLDDLLRQAQLPDHIPS